MSTDMLIFDPVHECASREEIRSLQLSRLQSRVKWAYERVSFYQKHMDKMGVHPSDIHTLEDVRRLPFTQKQDLRDTYPFGLFAVDMDEVIRLHASSGTTGKPIVAGYNAHDMEVWKRCIARLATMAGITSKDRIQMAFGYGMFTGGFGLHQGLEYLGCTVIPAGAGNTERHIMMIQDYGATVLVATPSYALHMCEVGEQMGIDWSTSTLRIGLFGGEPCSMHLKREIESRMHIVCTDNYGLTEVMGPGVSGECLVSRSQQHIAEDEFLWEIVDPETGEPLPEGAEGELVLTPLTKQVLPVLRYRTHDLTRITTEPCKCGRTLARMDKVKTRTDDMLIVRATNVFPSTVAEILSGIPGVSAYHRIEVDNPSGMDVMTVFVEITPEAMSDSLAQMNAFKKHIEAELRKVLLVSATVKLVEPGGIERTTGKAKRVIDHRK